MGEGQLQRDIVVNVALIVISMLGFAFMSEILLRWYGYKGAPESIISNIKQVDDKVLNWRYVPNSLVESSNISYRYNDTGFRDITHTREQAPGTRRMVVVGDSVSEGAGVSWESVFAAQLQARLGTGYEVINLAMGGLNTPQEIHLLEKDGLAYKPDVIILNFVLNDCDFYTEYYATQRFVQSKDSMIGILGLSINPEVKRLLKSSAFIYFIKERTENLLGRLTGKAETNYYIALWGNPENRQRVVEGLARLTELSRLHSFRALIVIWPLLTDYRSYKFLSIHEWVTSEAKKNGLEVVDLLKNFAEMSYRDLQVTAEDNVHPNAAGHRIAAETVFNILDEH